MTRLLLLILLLLAVEDHEQAALALPYGIFIKFRYWCIQSSRGRANTCNLVSAQLLQLLAFALTPLAPRLQRIVVVAIAAGSTAETALGKNCILYALLATFTFGAANAIVDSA